MSDTNLNLTEMKARAHEAKMLADAATIGPWSIDTDNCVRSEVTNHVEHSPWRFDSSSITTGNSGIANNGDAAFIAASRDLVPSLADDVEALATKVERLTGKLNALCEAVDDATDTMELWRAEGPQLSGAEDELEDGLLNALREAKS